MKYRKKPIVIDAMRFTDETKDQVLNFVTCNKVVGYENNKPVLIIQTLEGNMCANLGDWVIKGIMGEFYPCKDEIFKQTYESIYSEKVEKTVSIEISEELKNVDIEGIRQEIGCGGDLFLAFIPCYKCLSQNDEKMCKSFLKDTKTTKHKEYYED